MSNTAVFRATTVCRRCVEALDVSGDCNCSRSRSAEKARANAAPASEPETAPPDPYRYAIHRRRAELGLPVELTEPRPATPLRAATPYRAPVFPLQAKPSADPYAAEIKRLRKQRGLKDSTLPATYSPTTPPDIYAAGIQALREERGLTA